MFVAQPIINAGGVLPSGAGAGITDDPVRGNTLALIGLGGADLITTRIHSRRTNKMHNNSDKSSGSFATLGPRPRSTRIEGECSEGAGSGESGSCRQAVSSAVRRGM